MAFHGRQGKGASRTYRSIRRDEAEERNKLTAPGKRKADRLGPTLESDRQDGGYRTSKSIRTFQAQNGLTGTV